MLTANCWVFPMHNNVALRSLLHTVHQQRQTLQNTSAASCKLRRDVQILILQISWVWLDCGLGLSWGAAALVGLG